MIPSNFPKRPNPPISESTKKEKGKSPEKEQLANVEAKETLVESGPFAQLPAPFQKKGFKIGSAPYIRCNEKNQNETLKFLSEHPSKLESHKKIHLGFSVWFNFDLISISRPAYALIGDIDDRVMDIFKGIGESLVKSENRNDFVTHFRDFIQTNGIEYVSLSPNDEIGTFLQLELERSDSWLSSDERFQFIKTLYEKGYILFLNLDITDKESFQKIQKWIESHKLFVDTLYASNIIEWLVIQGNFQDQKCMLNLQSISNKFTRFIQAYKPGGEKDPIQFVVQGVDNMQVPRIKRKKIQSTVRTQSPGETTPIGPGPYKRKIIESQEEAPKKVIKKKLFE